MIRKLLIAYDGSDSAKAAFELAMDLAGKYRAELHVLAVARPPEFGDEVETEAIIESSRRHYAEVLEPLKMQVGKLAAHFEIKVGHPAESIVLYAEDHGIDHIVVGHRGHSLLADRFGGPASHCLRTLFGHGGARLSAKRGGVLCSRCPKTYGVNHA